MAHRSLPANLFAATMWVAGLLATPAGAAEGRPRLVVVVVVDQLRGDLPLRAAAASPGGGFERILKGGTVYDQAYYEHATTATAPGHATLFTGAYPSQHGIVGNEWYERDAQQRTSSVTAPAHGREIGPWNLRATTVGDELRLACGVRCRVFAVSGKDRGAVLPAGHVGKAFWFDVARGGFRSSAYYAPSPDWVAKWNAGIPPAMYPAQWTLLRAPSAYAGAADDDRSFERPPAALGKTFPHALGQPGGNGYYELFLHTPFVDALTLAFVRELARVEGLGRNDTPDFLSVSLSATDYVGHSFGPESLESADNLVRLDRALADFIGFLDERVGRERYLLVLTADHGLGATPDYSATLGFPAQRIDAESLSSTVDRELAARLRVPPPAVSAFVPPALYLDRAKLAAAGVSRERAAAAAAEVLRAQPGVAHAFTSDGFAADPAIAALVENSLYEPRSGDVYVVPEPESAIVEGLNLYTA
jgi:hypothetical protein